MRTLLREAWAGLQRRGAATAVAVGGLTLALAAGLLVALIATAVADPFPDAPDPERVVVLDFKGNPPGRPGPWLSYSPVAFGPLLKTRSLPLDQISRVAFDGIDIEHEGRVQPAYKLMADPDVVPLLGLKVLAGDFRAALQHRDGIAITIGLLRKLWGELPPAQALGRTLLSRGQRYTVLAVLPPPDPRAPFGDANPMVGDGWAWVGFDSQGNGWSEADRDAIFMANGRVFARLREGASVAQVGGWMREAFVASPGYAALPADWKAGREAAYFRGLTLTQLPFEGEVAELRWQLIGAVAAACVLLLLMAAFNHMNLQAAALLQRQRETALRRCLGATSGQLLRLWAMEALLPLAASAAGALLLAWWAAPAVAHWMGLSPVQPVADPLPGAVLAGLAAAVLLLLPLTLTVPAMLALQRAPAPALQGRTASEGPWGRRLRQGLLGLQLAGALGLLALAGVLALQQQHLLQAERGFDVRHRLWLGLMVDPQNMPPMEGLIRALDAHPAVLHWAFSGGRLGRDTEGRKELHVSAGAQRQVLRVSTVSSGFIETFGLKLLAGSVAKNAGSGGEPRLVIDAKAARLLGFASPQQAVGALLRGGGGYLQEGQEQRRVIAVVQDVKLESARDPALPQAFIVNDKPQWDIALHGRDTASLRAAIDEVWKAHGPPVPHELRAADEMLAEAYQLEQQLTTLLIGLALLAMGVALVGAYALVADTLRRRRTELVLRRLHGAGPAAMARELLREFAGPLLGAAAVALPLAGWLGEMYLGGFVDRIDPLPGLAGPLAVALAAIVLVLAAAAARHLRLALALQPAEALG